MNTLKPISSQFYEFVTLSLIDSQCVICSDYFTPANFPVIICKNHHFLCQPCRKRIVDMNYHMFVDFVTRCPFCRQVNPHSYAFPFKILNQTIKFREKGFFKLDDKEIEREEISQKIKVLSKEDTFLREGQKQKLVYKIMIVFLTVMLLLIISSVIFVMYLSYEEIAQRITLRYHLVILRFSQCYNQKHRIMRVRQITSYERFETELCWKIYMFLVSA